MATKDFHDSIQITGNLPRIISDHGNPQDRQLAMIVGVDFSYGGIESIPNSILDAVEHAPFIFEISRFPDQQSHAKRADNHG